MANHAEKEIRLSKLNTRETNKKEGDEPIVRCEHSSKSNKSSPGSDRSI
jgi:hypothetical protein